MIVFVNNRQVNLNDQNFLAEGGEGKLYRVGNTVYKIAKPFSETKWNELSVLTDHRLIKPLEKIYNNKGTEVGYTMNFVPGDQVCRLFTKSYKHRNGLNNDNIVDLIYDFRSLIQHVHDHQILVIDLNETNFLHYNKEIFGIDINSYKTASTKQLFLADSVRDWHANKYSNVTDWYSWAIVTFRMLIGIHPYGGKHPNYTGPIDETLKSRALNNISVFNKSVGIPQVCESLSIIPKALSNWYMDIFEHGKRLLPPTDFDKMPKQTQVTISSSVLDITEEKIKDNILSIHEIGGLVIRGEKGTYLGKITMPYCDYVVGLNSRPLLIRNHDWIYGTQKGTIDVAFDSIFVHDNKVYLVTEDSILLATFNVIGGNVIISYSKVSGRFQSIKLGDGCAIQTIFGDLWLLPHNIKLPITGTLVDAKLLGNHLLIRVADNNVYKTYLYTIGSSPQELNSDDINFSLKDDLLVIIIDDGILLKKNNHEKLILNHGLQNLKIEFCGDTLYGFNKNKLYKLKVK